MWTIGLFKQPGKKARARAAENFRRMLDPEELRLFNESYDDGGKWHEEFKSEWKKAKKKHGVENADEECQEVEE